MNIQIDEQRPIEFFNYQIVAPGGRAKNGYIKLQEERLPIFLGTVADLDCDLDFMIITSDLQGVVEEEGETKLLGEVLPAFLKLLFNIEFPETSLDKVGVLLCGDLFARTDKRGGLGDVKTVWNHFNQHFAFVAGVAGNHDAFGPKEVFESFKNEAGIFFLDQNIKQVAGLTLGGISGIIGRPDKHFRTEESEYLKALKRLLSKQTDFILLHEGPDHVNPDMIGNPKIRQLIELYSNNTICFGHNHWDKTLIVKEKGNQIINLDAKCLILKIEK